MSVLENKDSEKQIENYNYCPYRSPGMLELILDNFHFHRVYEYNLKSLESVLLIWAYAPVKPPMFQGKTMHFYGTSGQCLGEGVT